MVDSEPNGPNLELEAKLGSFSQEFRIWLDDNGLVKPGDSVDDIKAKINKEKGTNDAGRRITVIGEFVTGWANRKGIELDLPLIAKIKELTDRILGLVVVDNELKTKPLSDVEKSVLPPDVVSFLDLLNKVIPWMNTYISDDTLDASVQASIKVNIDSFIKNIRNTYTKYVVERNQFLRSNPDQNDLIDQINQLYKQVVDLYARNFEKTSSSWEYVEPDAELDGPDPEAYRNNWQEFRKIIDFFDDEKKEQIEPLLYLDKALEKYIDFSSNDRLKRGILAKIKLRLNNLRDSGITSDEFLADFIDREEDLQPLLDWLEATLAYAEALIQENQNEAEPGPVAAATEPVGAVEYGFDVYDEVITLPLGTLINNLVTNTYPDDDAQTWRKAFEKRISLLSEKGGEFVNLANLLEQVLMLYLFGVFKKGDSISLDKVSVNWEVAQKKLADNSAINSYDSFRSNELYSRIVDKIAQKSRQLMSEKTNWAADKGNWSDGGALIKTAHEQLMNEDDDYANFLRSLGDGQDSNEGIVKFLIECGHYETAICDYRSRIAIEALGKKRSAVKHKEVGVTSAGKEQPQSWLAKLSYKIGKNNDAGIFASALGWLELPQDLKRTDGDALKEKQVDRFSDRSELISEYITYVFGNKKAAEAVEKLKWRPSDMFDCFPHLDDALHITDRLGGERPNSLNIDHYVQTWGALNSLYETASTCWTSSLEDQIEKMDARELNNFINEKISAVGTQAAIALAYIVEFPDDTSQRGAMLDSVRAAISFYIVYLLSQIKIESGVKSSLPGLGRIINGNYEEKLGIVRKAMRDYIELNSSLDRSYKLDPGSRDEINLATELLEVVNNDDFRRKPIVFPDIAKASYNEAELRHMGAGTLPVLVTPLEKLKKEPEWPFGHASNRSAVEGEKN